MSFKKDVFNFKSYTEEKMYMHSLPEDIWTPMPALIRKAAGNSDELKAIINNIAELTGGRITRNWGWDFLEQDIIECVSDIRKKCIGGRIKHFEVFMDCLAVLHDVGGLTIEDLNEFLEEQNIGYQCVERGLTKEVCWYPIEGTDVIDDILTTQDQVKDLSEQALERFESAKRQFEEASDERARKDAVRSCVDAMEALIKELGAGEEIGEATKNLKNEIVSTGEPVWGPVQIIKDGNNIFNLLHTLYPDVRHGTQDIATTNMTMEEAEYFVGRITVFMKYVAAKAKKRGK